MSITPSQRMRLGVFLTTGVVLLALFLAIPLGLKLREKQKHFYSYFEGESLSGLEQGAVVKFHGVPIGKVEHIAYDPSNLLRVRVELRIQEEFPFKTDMYAQTGMVGITGLKYVEILGGSNEAALLTEGSEIPSKQSPMAALTGKADEIVAKVELLLYNLALITHPDSLAGVKSIIDNVEVITADSRHYLSTLGPDIQTGAQSIQNLVATIDSIANNMNSMTSQVNTMLASGALNTIVAGADSTLRSLNNVSEDLSLIVRQTREDIIVSMENLRETMENANQLSKMVTENPSLLLRGNEQQRERVIR
jgi:phospholipid/cholesterol/gamma-HCH transport system substrate-binding protein